MLLKVGDTLWKKEISRSRPPSLSFSQLNCNKILALICRRLSGPLLTLHSPQIQVPTEHISPYLLRYLMISDVRPGKASKVCRLGRRNLSTTSSTRRVRTSSTSTPTTLPRVTSPLPCPWTTTAWQAGTSSATSSSPACRPTSLHR